MICECFLFSFLALCFCLLSASLNLAVFALYALRLVSAALSSFSFVLTFLYHSAEGDNHRTWKRSGLR